VTREVVRREVVVTREGIEMQRHSYLQHSHVAVTREAIEMQRHSYPQHAHVVVTRECIESQMHSYLQHSHTVSTHIPLQHSHTSNTHTVQHTQQGRVTCFTIHPHHWYCTHTDQYTRSEQYTETESPHTGAVHTQTSAHSRDGLLEQTCPRKLHLDKCSSEYTHTGAVHTQTSAH
jgi:hypothetical protein